MEHKRLLPLLDEFRKLRIMVVGDLGLDCYLIGDAGRISREYPVIILNHKREEYRLGGAANTVANLVALGAEVIPAGWIGEDADGEQMLKLLKSMGCDTGAVVQDPTATTVTKTRIVAGDSEGIRQHLLRVDRLNSGELNGPRAEGLVSRMQGYMQSVDGFILSDYGHGTLTPFVVQAVMQNAAGRYIGLDSRHRLLSYPGVTSATPNLEEASEAAGMQISDVTTLETAGYKLLQHLDAEALLITRGGEGMSLFEPERHPIHIPVANLSEVFDVTGAGDTVVAAFTLARLGGGSFLEAAHLANIAAGLSVRRAGATPVPVRELREALR